MHQLGRWPRLAAACRDKTLLRRSCATPCWPASKQLDPQLNSLHHRRPTTLARARRKPPTPRAPLEQAAAGRADCAQGHLRHPRPSRPRCGSKMLAGYPGARTTPPWSAKLADAGSVTLGKLNMDEFAMGSANETPACYGPVRQPLGPRPRAGRLLAAARPRPWPRAWLPAATGTDTGGSIRQPASLLRHHRHQAHLWPRQPLRHDRLRLQPRPGRPDGAQRRRLRPAAERDGGPDLDRDSTSLDRPAEDFTRQLRMTASDRPAHRPARRSSLAKAWRPMCRAAWTPR